MSDFDIYKGDGVVHAAELKRLPDEPLLFKERGAYQADPELAEAVNIALWVGQPLLLTGEPGCGKTRLAWSIAQELGLGEPLVFATRSTSRAQDLLYTYDAVGRFNDIQLKDARAADAHHYIRYEALGKAIVEGQRRVVLVDEIDKAPRDFPNDLLTELDRMSFDVRELPEGEREKKCKERPVVIITSNSERQLPHPFLRRCVFHHIRFPDRLRLIKILKERLGPDDDWDPQLIEAAVDRFREVREIRGITKLPATGELLAWTLALRANRTPVEAIKRRGVLPPQWQVLIKDRDDLRRLQEAG